MIQFTKATNDINEALMSFFSINNSDRKNYRIIVKENELHDNPIMILNHELLKDYRNWNSLYGQPSKPTDLELEKMCIYEKDLTLNYTSTWPKVENVFHDYDNAIKKINDYYEKNILPIPNSGGPAGTDFAMKKIDFLKMRNDLPNDFNLWYYKWVPKVPMFIPVLKEKTFAIYHVNIKQDLKKEKEMIQSLINFYYEE